MTTLSLIQRIRSIPGGRPNSKAVNNGYGKSEYKTELIAVVGDSEELRSASEDKFVDKLIKQLKMVNGTKFNANNL